MKKLFIALLILFSCNQIAFATDRYASPSGSGSTCSTGSPCKAQTAIDASSPGDVVILRGNAGSYNTKLNVGVSGSAGNFITIRSYTGELAKIDGYVTRTLNGSINSSTTTITLSDATDINEGDVFIFQDAAPDVAEHVYLNGKSGNTFTSCVRGWSGRTPASHTSGVTMVLGGNQFDVTGSYIIIKDLEIMNSDPVRVQTAADSQNAPNLRGEGIFNTGDNNQFLNNYIHDNQDGIFNSQNATGTDIIGNWIFLNGYVAGGAYNGHGIYVINETTGAGNTVLIKANFVFNNSNMGIKGDSQNNDCTNIRSENNISFNSGAWADDGNRKFNLLMASNNGVADDITVINNYLYHPNAGGGSLRLGLGGATNGDLVATGNYVGGGTQPLEIDLWANITFTGNTLANQYGDRLLAYVPLGGASLTWNNNTYNTTDSPSYLSYNYDVATDMNFTNWKSTCGCDGSSTETRTAPTSNVTFLVANPADSTKAHIVVYNWTSASTVNVDVSGFVSNGASYTLYAVEEGQVVTPIQTGTVSGGVIAMPMTGSTVAEQIGEDGVDVNAIVTMRPDFGAFMLVIQSTPSRGARGNVKFRGRVSIR